MKKLINFILLMSFIIFISFINCDLHDSPEIVDSSLLGSSNSSSASSISIKPETLTWPSALSTFTEACIANGAKNVIINEVSDVPGVDYQYTSTYHTNMKFFAGDFRSLKFYLKASDAEVLIDYDSMEYKFNNDKNGLSTYKGRKIYEAFYVIYTYFYGAPSELPQVLAYMCTRNTRYVTDFANGDFLMKFLRFTRNEENVFVAKYYSVYKKAVETKYTIVNQWLDAIP